jgi:uncharacterized protein DUF6640
MDRFTLGKTVMTFVLGAGAILGFVLDWSPNHLLNPEWHPHARFHGALLLFLWTGVSAIGVWLLWRRSAEPELAMKIAALISLSFWTPFFYITAVLPNSTLWAGPPGAMPRVAGVIVYPNVVVAVAFLILTVAAYKLAHSPLNSTSRS